MQIFTYEICDYFVFYFGYIFSIYWLKKCKLIIYYFGYFILCWNDMKQFSVIICFLLLFFPFLCMWINYSTELEQAYDWSYKNNITTQDSINKANIEWKLTRAELAKMISTFSINILWSERDVSQKCVFSDVSYKIDEQYGFWITYACQLWLMWQNIDQFRPSDSVSRAEFWTVLSRALWWNKNGWWTPYYENHLMALKSEWIMKNISSPESSEIRWYVMLMLMRSVLWVDDEIISNDQISEVLNILD